MQLRLLCLFCGSGLMLISTAPLPQISVQRGGVDSVPQTTIVPVLQPVVHITDTATHYNLSLRGLHGPERRSMRAKIYAAKVDSLVQSRNYMFFPNSMQEYPRGLLRMIYNGYYYLGFFVNHAQVHLLTAQGFSQYVEMLNFDSSRVVGYRATRESWGWSVRFTIFNGDQNFGVNFAISTTSGETILILQTAKYSVRYIGYLSDKQIDNPRLRTAEN